MHKPYSPACDENREPIHAAIAPLLTQARLVLEIGSGTGQHAVYFAGVMPQLVWQTSDLEAQLEGIRLWLDEAGLPNTPPPLALDVTRADWPALTPDAIFTANTFHIMPWEAVTAAIVGAAHILAPGGRLLVYGPVNYGGEYTSTSNARFDEWLRLRDPASGIRNFEDLDAKARAAGLQIAQDIAMPANNRTLVWRKVA
jgi:SAM-dependent methyltransferase